jgi:hypothetical protein
LDITEGSITASRDSDVHRLDGPKEGLVNIFFGHLKLEKGTVNLVDNDDGFDTLAKCLPEEDSLSLHTYTFDKKSTVCHVKGSSDF